MRPASTMKRYNAFLELDQIEALKKLAQEKGTSVSDLLRQAIDKLLADGQ